MIELFLVGIGFGNFEYLILEVICVLEEVDLILLLCKGDEKIEFVDLCCDIVVDILKIKFKVVEFDYLVCDVKMLKYLDGVNMWYDVLVEIWMGLIVEYGSFKIKVVLMVWGDLSFYDSMLCIVECVVMKGISLNICVVSGIMFL